MLHFDTFANQVIDGKAVKSFANIISVAEHVQQVLIFKCLPVRPSVMVATKQLGGFSSN